MGPAITARNETDADLGTITDVTVAAFSPLEISNHTSNTSSRHCVPRTR
ncbi:hypothetical protein DSCA_52160 [Desulfosarcina alkanivorans]|jgi:hypothetical protein|uniref:Uncharacterized protein n=1 Tax=Desulfosarcina alkanivorans TaxID=571177 RepID=A0A5K7YPV4_9BACT|nr:hypothetical protein DSCA_52160 [Desulfosarcina alkanivorans]